MSIQYKRFTMKKRIIHALGVAAVVAGMVFTGTTSVKASEGSYTYVYG